MSRHFRIVLFLLIDVVALAYQVEAQDSKRFITLDCGLPAGSSYIDEETGIKYISDEAFVETGVGASISPAYNTSGTKRWLQTLRSFPKGKKNCYTFTVAIGIQFLVRVTFKYGDYDGRNKSLGFSMDVDSMDWDDIQVDDPANIISKEIILMTTITPLFFCLNNTGNGTPFISLLQLRPLKDAPYNTNTGSLVNIKRVDFGSMSSGVVRYPDDALDRFWKPLTNANWTTISTLDAIDSHDCFTFRPPTSVMRTASSPKSGDDLEFVIDELSQDEPIRIIHVYLYFAELQKLGDNQSRQFSINSSSDFRSGPKSPSFLKTSIVYDTEFEYIVASQSKISLTKTRKSTLPPAINALEIYHEILRLSSHLDQGEVDAMMKIKLMYGVKKWQGEPCHSAWDGVTCRYKDAGVSSMRIIALLYWHLHLCVSLVQPIASFLGQLCSLNLSFGGLVGAITANISGLTYLETLDLSNNSLMGYVPEFLALMPSLKILNLTFDKLNGTVPCSLIEKSEKNLLLMNLTGNPDLILSPLSCTTGSNSNNHEKNRRPLTKKSRIVFLVSGSVAAALMSAVTAIIIFRSCIISRRFFAEKQGQEAIIESTKSLESNKGKKGGFTHSQLLAITNNLKVILGQGGSGTVYHGYLHGKEVAVKILFPSTAQGYKQFKAEVDILLRVHHGNLLSLIGYCDDNNHLGLIYEYMANGNFQDYISSCDNKEALSWEERLKIALSAAHGLEYLHTGCEPQIVHRDVKTANILLNEKLLAKLADFGLSRSFPAARASHLFTDVAGTFGYFDPEYFRSHRFTTKSDVYSFGVVLLEIATSKPAVDLIESTTHLSQWVAATLLAGGEITQIIDPKLGVDYDLNSANKAVQLALACLSETSSMRPTMHQVVDQLTDCLELELARKINKHEAESENSD